MEYGSIMYLGREVFKPEYKGGYCFYHITTVQYLARSGR
jgi:hypothetical protein